MVRFWGVLLVTGLFILHQYIVFMIFTGTGSQVSSLRFFLSCRFDSHDVHERGKIPEILEKKRKQPFLSQLCHTISASNNLVFPRCSISLPLSLPPSLPFFCPPSLPLFLPPSLPPSLSSSHPLFLPFYLPPSPRSIVSPSLPPPPPSLATFAPTPGLFLPSSLPLLNFPLNIFLVYMHISCLLVALRAAVAPTHFLLVPGH